jgi:hypothetical protein
MESEVQYAKGPCGPVCAVAAGDEAYTCYECGDAVFSKRAHKRRRNGIAHDVRSHFCHKSGSTCKGESVEHLAAKDALLTCKHYTFFVACRVCNAAIQVHVEGDRSTELTWGAFRLDVGVKSGDTIVGAIEVLHTHEIGDAKALALTEGGCEVRASKKKSASES